VWECVIRGQKGPLVVLEYPGGKGGGMMAAQYQKQVLDCILVDFLEEMKVKKGDVIFQQDNATLHKAEQTQNWFKAYDIKLLFYPANSPDFNPIKDVWHKLKHCLHKLQHHPTNVEQLKEVIQKIWDEMDIEDVNKYIDRMPQVVEALKKANEGHTKF
jgi:transposase